ncbi:aromatic-ring hydroxylase C-terminal domain-containing protein [Amycolatopsis sulphurea]|uniref:aromatic-ring hydroxylase C-terminal domain-containing protein n=1 Tax=Amycolatopsis sulphurea TaxID=76022 RepID=UPI0031839D12
MLGDRQDGTRSGNEPVARVGARVPHLWLGEQAVHDLLVAEFVLLCDSPEWTEAARAAGIRACRAERADGWAERYGSGAVLVRPDGYLAWRARAASTAGPAEALGRALHSS